MAEKQISKRDIDEILRGYKKFSIATICSHSSLQIFHGARIEGIKTIGLVTEDKKELYESFPLAKPDEFIVIDDYKNIPVEELIEKEAIVIPHGSFVEYIGEKFDNLALPIYGNRKSIMWERSREKMFEWMKAAGIRTPKILKPNEINGPTLVKFPGAKGGHGYLIVNSEEEFYEKVGEKECMLQEFIIGVRAYPHYFSSPISKIGYKTKYGRLEILGVDKRVESSADEIARAVSAGLKPPLSFTVVGNEPMVLRESLLYDYMEIGRKVYEKSFDLFGGIFGPFCIETIINDDLEIFAFEISARIVAGTNVYIPNSPYSLFYYKESMNMGRRIARELKTAKKLGRLSEIIY